MIDRWPLDYRAKHPIAAEWAEGSRVIRHSLTTQGRIFRMVEQIRVNRPTATVDRLFADLIALDMMVDPEHAPRTAAIAGVAGFRKLFGTLPPVDDDGLPEGFESVDEGEAELAALGLQALGFDPILIDGGDPAAYVWALFETQQRKLACTEVVRLGHHAAAQPQCLAVIAEPSIRRTPPAVREPDLSRELAGARR